MDNSDENESRRLSQRDQKDNFEEILLDEKICFQVGVDPCTH